MSTEPTTRAEQIAKLAELIKEIDFAMLTTVDEHDGTLRSRPMSTQKEPFDGDLWFFTEASAPKVDDVQREQQVNLAYADPKSQRYVSMSGTAQLVRDLEKKKQLWEPTHKIYFPNGPEDPNVALLRVTVSKAEYWESGSNPVTRMFDFAKALVTGDHEQLGENQKVNLAR